MNLTYIGTVLLLVFGFGFVIFWHELGHFLAAKWAGVKVEQFAVGFGQAMFSWRKGLGFRWGSSVREYEARIEDHLSKAEATRDSVEAASADRLAYRSATQVERAIVDLGLGETEYRLNWIPLGGYVKMLGQDDMNPNALSESPRAYNMKPIGKRMVIVSAGVVMNIILAIILFTVLFGVIGFDAPPSVVGAVLPGSPAQQAGIHVGDRILTIDGVPQHDFTKISMNVALAEEGATIPVVVRSPDGATRTLQVAPQPETGDSMGFLKIGIGPSPTLRGTTRKVWSELESERPYMLAEPFTVAPGETIVAIDGQPVGPTEFFKLDQAAQQSFGKPISLTISDASGKTRQAEVRAHFADPYGSAQFNLLGMTPRALVDSITPGSSARDKLKPGDVIVAITLKPSNDTVENLSPHELSEKLQKASEGGSTIDVNVLRDEKPVTVAGLTTNLKLETGGRGLGVALGLDAAHPVIGTVASDSPAGRANVPAGATIVSVNDQPVQNWFDVHRALVSADAAAGKVKLVVRSPNLDSADSKGGGERTFELAIHDADAKAVASVRYAVPLLLEDLSEPRKTGNPLVAASWGVGETRDLITQFYLTLRRMVQGSVAAKNAMGPVGIFYQGSKIANRGGDWLVWFLAMISANLAVVNFLPIPIVDGGLFVFLIVEKIMRRPLSARAQSIAQIVGLALIVSVFLFVTYHDIARML